MDYPIDPAVRQEHMQRLRSSLDTIRWSFGEGDYASARSAIADLLPSYRKAVSYDFGIQEELTGEVVLIHNLDDLARRHLDWVYVVRIPSE